MCPGSTFRFPAPSTLAADPRNEASVSLGASPRKSGDNTAILSRHAFVPVASPDADYFTLSAEPAPKAAPSHPASGSISSVGSEATLSSASSSYTDHSRTLSNDTLVEAPSPTLRSRFSLGRPGAKPGPFAVPERPGVAPLENPRHRSLSGHSPSRNYTEPLPPPRAAPAPLPMLRKQQTLPCLSLHEPSKEAVAGAYAGVGSGNMSPRVASKKEDFRDAITKLSPTISFMAPERVCELIEHSRVSPETGLRDVLVLDIRSFAEYAKGHVAGAINICLPSTLLKRATFNLSRCVVSLPTYEKTILQNYFHHNAQNVAAGRRMGAGSGPGGAYGLPAIVIYDTHSASANLFHICKKLVDFSCYDAAAAPPIHVVDCSFEAFGALHASHISSGSANLVDLSTLSLAPEAAADGVPPLRSTPAPPPLGPRSASMDLSKLGNNTVRTPIISNFSLPKNLPQSQFKIRHNEEKFDFSVVEEEATVPLTSPEARLLPPWLRDSVANSAQIRQSFSRLEECEKRRLNSAFRLDAQKDFRTPGGSTDVTPVINSGLDYGHKNRYKDIFLYEHSRVTLSDLDGQRTQRTGGTEQTCDYINASYLRPCVQNAAIGQFLRGDVAKQTQLHYLATQGPMQRTGGDFWRCIHNQQCLLVVSLTGETDNGVEKCYAFWKPGDYYSDEQRVQVRLVGSDSYKNVVVRRFEVDLDGVTRHVTQLHLSTWQDMTSEVDLDEILFMVRLKHRILSAQPHLPAYPSAIHCSAGCGRSGVFVAADTLINTLDSDAHMLQSDPVYEVVNDLRKQRISMVQTLRQYSLIYNILRECIVRPEDFGRDLVRMAPEPNLPS